MIDDSTLLVELIPKLSNADKRSLLTSLITCMPVQPSWEGPLAELQTILGRVPDDQLTSALDRFRSKLVFPFKESPETTAMRCIGLLADLWDAESEETLHTRIDWLLGYLSRLGDNTAHVDHVVRSAYKKAGLEIPEWAE